MIGGDIYPDARLLARATDPSTSFEAGYGMSGREAATLRGQVLRLMRLIGRPVTDKELEQTMDGSGWSPDRVRHARLELLRKGYVRHVGQAVYDGEKRRTHEAIPQEELIQ